MRTPRLLSSLLALSAATATLAAPTPAKAGSPLECAPSYEADPLRLLRQVSLDLLGRPATYEELELVRSADDRHAAVEDAITQMLASEEYYANLRGYHQELLWSNLSNKIAQLVPRSSRLRKIPNAGGQIWANAVGQVRKRYRGLGDLYCVNQEQTEFDPDGRPIPMVVYEDEACAGGTCRQEGWVWVEPYWAPNEPIKVCAYDAQDFEYGTQNPDKLCSDRRTLDAGCGCGADLRYCVAQDAEVRLRESLAQESARVFEWVIRSGQSYLEAFRTNNSMMNGPVAHYYKWMRASASAATANIAFEADMGELPELPFEDADTWVPVSRGSSHAGAFTTASYLLRFATDRGRANRFYTAFYCDPFVPSVDGLPAEEELPSPNLREREGCAGCHEVLEPAAAHFARWRKNGAYGYLDQGLLDLQEARAECMCGEGTGKKCSNFCNKYYVTADNSDPATYTTFGGVPLTSAYANASELQDTELGPAALVDEPSEQYAIAQCAVRTMAERLLHRPLESTELGWVSEQTEHFVSSGYDFTAMVAQLIADERYRQAH